VPIGEGAPLLSIAGRPGPGRQTAHRPLSDEVSIEQAQVAARVCALKPLAQMEAAAGLDNVEQCHAAVRLVLSADGFGDQPKVVNGASDLIVDGPRRGRETCAGRGRHQRAALLGTVEIAAVAVVRTAEQRPAWRRRPGVLLVGSVVYLALLISE